MFNLDKFIADSVTKRPVSMFAPDIHTFETISKIEACQTDPSAYGYQIDYLLIDWQKSTVNQN